MLNAQLCVCKMLGMRRGNINQIHIFILHQFLIGSIGFLKPIFLCKSVRFFLASGTNGICFHIIHLRNGLCHTDRNTSRSYNRHPHFFHFEILLFCLCTYVSFLYLHTLFPNEDRNAPGLLPVPVPLPESIFQSVRFPWKNTILRRSCCRQLLQPFKLYPADTLHLFLLKLQFLFLNRFII